MYSLEHHLHMAFYLQDFPDDRDVTTVRIVGDQTQSEPVAVVEFTEPYAYMFGPPKDEAFSRHPLASRGLRPGTRVIVDQALGAHDSAHPRHRPERFVGLEHYILSFHDTTFECVARRFAVSTHTGSVAEVLQNVLRGIVSK
ncbi:MAG: hypothetical protein JWM99_2591 [Verrucomicrobiales bacterium]|nr:hypothetical protein [Verrucomicrobiales bacterium]